MYQYLQIEEGENPLFAFTTKNFVDYYVSFNQVASENISEIFSFDFGKTNGEKSKFDIEVKETIISILNDFIAKNPTAILHYVCDSLDGKQDFRLRLFNQWFDENVSSDFQKLTLNYINDNNEINYKLEFIFNVKFYSTDEIAQKVNDELDYFSTFK